MSHHRNALHLLGLALLVVILLLTITPSQPLAAEETVQPLAENIWSARGPRYNLSNREGPEVNAIAFDPHDLSRAFAATNQGMYVSTDDGISWEPTSRGLIGFGRLNVTDIAVDSRVRGRITIATWGGGMLRSANDGRDWVRLPGDPLDSARAERGIVPESDPLSMAGVIGPGPHWSPDEPSQTDDDGERADPLRMTRTAMRCVSINPNRSAELYACVDDGHGLYHSLDDGATWSRVPIAQNEGARTMEFAPSNPTVRYASFGSWSTSGGFFRSTDSGQSWQQIGINVINATVVALAIHPTDANLVLAATAGQGIFRTTNGGVTWSPIGSLPPGTYYSVAFAPSSPSIVYAGSYWGVYLSRDAGATWVNADPDLDAYYYSGLAIDPDVSDRVLVGSSQRGGVYRRSATTRPFNFNSGGMGNTFVLDVEQDPHNPAILYAATWGAGAFRTTDSGLSWQRVLGEQRYVYDILAAANGSGVALYATTFYSDWGIFRSNDRGNSWSQQSNVYPSHISFRLNTIDNNPNWLVAATFAGIQRSFDGGITWNASFGLDSAQGMVLDICTFRNGYSMLAATYGGGLFYSPYYGIEWFQANDRLSERQQFTYAVACSPDVDGMAWVAGNGMYRTTNFGENWTLVNAGLPGDDFMRGVDIVPGTGDVFAGSYNTGMYYLRGGTSYWHTLNSGLLWADRSIEAVTVVSPTPTVFIGTNGSGTFSIDLINRRRTFELRLPSTVSNARISQSGVSSANCQSYESNNSFAQATNLSRPGLYCSYIDSSADVDYYRFTVTRLGTITLDLSQIPANSDYDIYLYDAGQNQIGQSLRGSNLSERLTFEPVATGTYYLAVVTYRGSNTEQPYYLSLDYNGGIAGGGSLSGTLSSVHETGDLLIRLYRYRGFFSPPAFTKTDSSGAYRFRNMPTLDIGHLYQVSFFNHKNQSQFLAAYYCPLLTSYTAGMNANICDFSPTDVNPRQPGNNAVVTLPATFVWVRRGVPGDNHELVITNGSQFFATGLLGNTNTYTLNALPAGFTYDTPYNWYMRVYNNGGYGLSRAAPSLTFSNTRSAPGNEEMPLLRDTLGIPDWPDNLRLMPGYAQPTTDDKLPEP